MKVETRICKNKHCKKKFDTHDDRVEYCDDCYFTYIDPYEEARRN